MRKIHFSLILMLTIVAVLAVADRTLPAFQSSGQAGFLTAPTEVNASDNSYSTKVGMNWNAIPGAESYYLRVDYGDNNAGDDWYIVPGEDFNLDEYQGMTFTAPVIPDHTYSWWVHGANSSSGLGPASGGTFSCSQ